MWRISILNQIYIDIKKISEFYTLSQISVASLTRLALILFYLVRFSRINGEQFVRVSLTAHLGAGIFYNERHLTLQTPKLHRCTRERGFDSGQSDIATDPSFISPKPYS